MSVQLKHYHAEDSCLKNHLGPTQRGPNPNRNDNNEQVNPINNIPGKRGITDIPGPSPANRGNEQPTADDPDGEGPYPEGGLTAWLVVCGSFCALVSVYGLVNSSAVFEEYFKTHQLKDYTHSEIGWIFSLYLFLVFFIGVQAGPVFDRFGPRLLVALGCLLVVLSLQLLSLSKTYYQIMLSYSVLGGLGGAMLNAPAYGAIAHFFNVKRGFATGVASTAGGVGGIVFPLLLRHLLRPNGVGFGWACRILGFILVGLAVPANLFIKSRFTAQLSTKGEGEEKGKPRIASVWPDLGVFRDARFALASAGYFFMEWGLFVPLTYLVSYGTAHGYSTSSSSLLLSLLNAGSVVGRFLPGLLSDKLGRFNVIIVTIAFCAITVLAIWLPCNGSMAVAIVFSITFGIASGSNLSLIPVCLGQFCQSQHYGRYFATSSMIASFGSLTSVPIAGAMLEIGDQDTGWMALILFAGCSYIVALICYISARVLTVGWEPRLKF